MRLVALLLLAAAASCAQPFVPSQVFHTPLGGLQGLVDPEGTTWLRGVPHSTPPVGPLRWMAPEPPSRWPGVFDASASSPGCLQAPIPGFNLTLTEDCLVMDIFIPNSTGLHPVHVFIHGGAYVSGWASLYSDAAAALARHTNSVVFVPQYRVGALGFWTSTAAQQSQMTTTNFGFLDQQQALRTINLLAPSLTGDPTNVMIRGESAGGGSMIWHWLHTSPTLFQRVLVESAGPWRWSTIAANTPAFDARVVAAGCNQASPAETMACLRGLPGPEAVNLNQYPSFGYPMLDDTTPVQLITDLKQRAAAGTLPTVPIVLGTNEQEGNLFSLQMSGSANFSAAVANYLFTLPDTQPHLPLGAKGNVSSLWYLPPPHGNNYFAAYADWFADGLLVCGSKLFADLVTAGGASVYVYRWQHHPEDYFDTLLNATHTTELMAFFSGDIPPMGGLAVDEIALSAEIVSELSTFHATGSPPAAWPAWNSTTGAPQWRVFGVDGGLSIDTQPATFSSICARWISAYIAESN